MASSLFGACAGGAVATFSAADFKVLYPNWAAVPDAQLQGYFDIATIYLRNDGSGPVRSTSTQTMLLYLMTAHITQLSIGANGLGASPLIGRVSSASEGSVSVGSDYPSTPNNAWFVQTPYGASFWQATAAYRMVHYSPGPTRFGNGLAPIGYFSGRRR